MQSDPSPIPLTEFDAADRVAALELIAPVCASPQWQHSMADARPFGSVGALMGRSATLIADLPWTEIQAALAAHPRIGQRAEGAEREAAWSRQEQSAAATPAQETAAALQAGNLEYERRFGQVFLICATGRSADQVLTALTARLANDVATEQRIVRTELAAIAAIRLGSVIS